MLDVVGAVLLTKSFWLVSLLLAVLAYLKFVVNGHWRRKGVPHEAPYVLFGNALPVFLKKSSVGNLIKRNYMKFRDHPFHGIYMFHKPFLVINDPELVRLVLIKEFARFQDRGIYHNDQLDPLMHNLFLLPGKKWRPLRDKLSPAFTATKLKQMFSLICETAEELVRVCDEMAQVDDKIDVKEMTSRYTTDTICSVAYGFKNDSLRDADNDFKRHGEMIFTLGGMRFALAAFAPKVMEFFRISFMSRNIIDFFVSAFEQVVKCRRQSNVVRKDFLGLLMQLMDRGVLEDDESQEGKESNVNSITSENKISFREAVGQPFVFFAAGYETTSATITYCLYELALNPELQTKLQEEIDEFASRSEGLTYDVIMNEMEYLEMVFSETLRKHSTLPMFNRLCVKDFDIPNSNFRIEKGTGILIPIDGIRHNPDIFPDPDKFDPSRFTKENIATRHPCTFLPFGGGPRYCIGIRLGTLQSKVALVLMLSKFRFSVCDKTQIPVVYSKKTFAQTPEGPVYLHMNSRSTCNILKLKKEK